MRASAGTPIVSRIGRCQICLEGRKGSLSCLLWSILRPGPRLPLGGAEVGNGLPCFPQRLQHVSTLCSELMQNFLLGRSISTCFMVYMTSYSYRRGSGSEDS